MILDHRAWICAQKLQAGLAQALPFVRLEKIVFIALVVSLVTAIEGQNMFQQRSVEFWKELESCGSWFYDFIVKSRVANELSG